MKKRILAALAATALVGCASAFAANPFADVPTDSWAYQAVTTLAEQGVVIGYPDGYFKGQRNITRYEMAQIIARAMVRADRIDAEQQAMINRLASEYADELRNLGVRVDRLEDKVGNVKLTGDARVRFQQKDVREKKKIMVRSAADDQESGKHETYDMRLRIGVDGMVGKNTSAGARLVLGDVEFGEKGDTNVTFDRLWVKHNMGQVGLTAGRTGLFLGEGLAVDSTIDGVSLGTNISKAGVKVGYGHAKLQDSMSKNKSFTYAQVNFIPYQNSDLKVYYAQKHGQDANDGKIYGAALDLTQKNVWVGGEYAKTKADNIKDENNDAWTAGIGFGNFDDEKANTFAVKARYVDLGENFDGADSTFSDFGYTKNLKGYNANVTYALAKNLNAEVNYYFHTRNHDGEKLDNNLIAQLNYKF